MRRILHQGLLDKDLFKFVSRSSSQEMKKSQAINGEVLLATSYIWHDRLGHASHNVMNKVFDVSNLQTQKNESSYVCTMCSLSKSH